MSKSKSLTQFALAVVLVAGVLVLGGNRVQAAPSDPVQQGSVGLQGTVKGPPPTTAPSITFPANGQTITTLPVKVGGSCTGDLLIKLFINGVFAGSAQCQNGSYTITSDLFNGKNDLVVRHYDALDQAGPDSATTTVTYSVIGFNNAGPRITLTSTFAKRGADPGKTITWPIILSGGTGPYAISVDWGDGVNQLISRSLAGSFDLTHSYKAPGVYTILIKVTDSNGESSFLQLVGVGNGILAQDANSTGSGGTATRTVILWWPILGAAGLVIVAFWLGGLHKLENLRRDAEKRIQY